MAGPLTAERARELLDYEPDTGLLWWKPRQTVTGRWFLKEAKIAGGGNGDGYIVVRIDRHLYYAHRVIFLMMTGEWPPEQVDHRELSRSDNRWDFMRAATNTENNQNRPARRDNRIGLKGVCLATDGGAFTATITVNGKQMHLGRFSSAQDAYAAYCVAADRYHGEFANHGRNK